MTVHVLMPVFNRLAMTQSMLKCLRTQCTDEPLSLVVVDDGSSDGTGAFLDTQSDLTILQGDGSLWWGGAVDLAIRHVLASAATNDWILLINNDTHIKSDFIQCLLDMARLHGPAAVGSVIRDIEAPHELLSIGPIINAWRLKITDARNVLPAESTERTHDVIRVDALSGRGVLYPVAALNAVGGMRPRWIPHYYADYELAVRVRAAGWRLLVGTSAVVYSNEEYGNTFRGSSLVERLFSLRSPTYLPAGLSFWWSASNYWQRATFPFRILASKLISACQKYKA